jgi:hypothetical protein
MAVERCDICNRQKGMCMGNCPNHFKVAKLLAAEKAANEPVVEEPKEEPKEEKKPKAKKAAKKAKK